VIAAADWVVISAIVQAASAVVVVLLTFFLVRFTGRYVGEMSRANQLQEQANAISSGLLSRAAMEDAPFLVATGGGGGGQKGGAGDMSLTVQNRGGSLAHDITVETTWGDGPLDSLGQGDQAMLTFHVDDGYDPSDPPNVIRFRFKDPAGVEWVQAPSRLPVQAADLT
jgi:hypothetical protein